MPESWYLMSQPLFNSGFEGDEFSAFAQGGFEEILESPLADDIEVYEKTLSATAVKTRAIIQGVTADNYNNSVLRQFLCRIGTLRSGQYIKARGQTWLVYSLPDNNKMYEKAIAWQCKYSIKYLLLLEKSLSIQSMISTALNMDLAKLRKIILHWVHRST